MKISKVVLIVVALHVLVIGGIFVFEGCSRSKAPALADNETQPGQAPADEAAMTATNLPDMATLPIPSAAVTPAPATETAMATAPVAPASITYVVKKGDSLWKIAKSQSIGVGELLKANNLTKTSHLKVGQKLTIPAKASSAPATAVASATTVAPAAGSAPATPEASGALYAVKSGDSLWKIANKNGVTVAALKKANNLSSDTLKVGQKLTIPAKAASATAAATAGTAAAPAASAGIATWSASADFREPGTYTENGQTLHYVDANETPAVIAKKYGVKLDDLMKANNISNAKQLHYGQRLVIPLPAATPVVSAAAPAAPIAKAAVAVP